MITYWLYRPDGTLDEDVDAPVRPNQFCRKAAEDNISRLTASAPEIPREELNKVDAIKREYDPRTNNENRF